MGFLSDILTGIKAQVGNDPRQYVVDEKSFDNELVRAMNNSGKAKVSSEDAALLSQSYRNSEKEAKDLDDSQKKSITLNASDMVIRAKNRWEKFVKEKRLNSKLTELLDKNRAAKGDLPKDYMVSKAEATNGKIKVEPANELEDHPREKGGRERDSRAK